MSCLHKTNIEQKQQNSKFLEVKVRLDNYFPIQKINRKTEFYQLQCVQFSEHFFFFAVFDQGSNMRGFSLFFHRFVSTNRFAEILSFPMPFNLLDQTAHAFQ